MITIRTITLELGQVLDTGEDQTLIVEYDGETATMNTDAWTQGAITMPHIIDIADSAYATACIELGGKQ